MLEALKASNEPEHLVQAATRYLKGLKGNLVQLKKQKQLKEHAARKSAANTSFQQQQYQYQQPPQQYHQQQQKMGYGQPIAPMPPKGPGFYTTTGWSA
jgi:hypothetical protein